MLADPRRPFLLDLRELGRHPGAMRSVRAAPPSPGDMRMETIGVPEGSPISISVTLESVVEGVYVAGTVSAATAGECARCLDPVTGRVEAELAELFAYPDSTTQQTTDTDEVRRIDSDSIDLEPSIRDALVLMLPLAPLCRPECLGLCPGCGQRRDQLPASHNHDLVDSRWAGLAERFGRMT